MFLSLVQFFGVLKYLNSLILFSLRERREKRKKEKEKRRKEQEKNVKKKDLEKQKHKKRWVFLLCYFNVSLEPICFSGFDKVRVSYLSSVLFTVLAEDYK
jgi:hypothetical protein